MQYEFDLVYRCENLYFGRFDMTEEEKNSDAAFIIKKALEETFESPLTEITQRCGGFHITSGESIFDFVGKTKLVFLRRDLEREFGLTYAFDDNETATESDLFGKMRDYVGKNYLKDDFGVKDIVSYMKMERSIVDITFKSNCGMSAKDYIIKMRLEMAKDLILLRTNMADCAARCGFGSEKTMRRVFNEKLGMTPSKYRKTMLGEYAERDNDDEL